VTVVDCPLDEKAWRTFENVLKSQLPEHVAIGIRNLDNSDLMAYHSYLGTPARMVRTLRNICPKAVVILGGAAVTVDQQKVLEVVGADHLILGEGEEALPDLLDELEKGVRCEKVIQKQGEPCRVENLSTLPLPRLHRWFDMGEYLKGDAGYPIQTKRGCPLHCTYCTYARIEGRVYRHIPAQRVADEIEGAMSSGVDTFEFVDSTFNLPPRHAKDVVQACLDRGLKAHYIGTGIHPAKLDSGLAHSMSALGFRTVIVTAESASETMLKSYRKGFTVPHLDRVGHTLREEGIQAMYVFLVGGPGETRETVEETLAYIDQKVKAPDVAYITVGVRLYPGAPMDEDYRQGNFLPKDVILGPEGVPFFRSSGLPEGWLEERLRQFQASHPHVMLSCEGQGALVEGAQTVLRWLKAPKPYWRYLPVLGRFRQTLRYPLTMFHQLTMSHQLRRSS
jgi:radical SAM superfamily enzyme YgiQ (UPF0313 family)